MAYIVLGKMLRQERVDEESKVFPEEIFRYFSDIVEFASKKFADMQARLNFNEHHISVLERAKESDKIPNFLKQNIPSIKYFPEESSMSLKRSFEEMQCEMAKLMLDRTLQERYILRLKLYKEAEALSDVVELEARTKWIDAQGDLWNTWDHVYPVQLMGRQDGRIEHVAIPLSASIYQIAMKKCNLEVTAIMQAQRRNNAEDAHKVKDKDKNKKFEPKP